MDTYVVLYSYDGILHAEQRQSIRIIFKSVKRKMQMAKLYKCDKIYENFINTNAMLFLVFEHLTHI